MTFKSLGLSQSITKVLLDQNFTKTYPIQEKVIPEILRGKDVMGIAKTGAGKTASYAFPIIHQQQKNKEILENRHLPVLVLVPTRELAEQIKDVFQKLTSHLVEKIKVQAVYGGVSINPQMKSMNQTSILVATPGRLLDLMQSKALYLSSLQTLVIDEADKMLSMGFKEEMDRIIEKVPKKCQHLLFSATLSTDIKSISLFQLRDPICIEIKEDEKSPHLIRQVGYLISEKKKGPMLRFILKKEGAKKVLIFTSSTYKADNVADKLRKNGIDASAIHSKKSQSSRLESLARFKSGSLGVIVATDLLSRGIDVDKLPLVINYELPRSPKDYVHRIGRTGRAESKGKAISLISPEEKHHFKIIQKKMGKWVDMVDGENLEL